MSDVNVADILAVVDTLAKIAAHSMKAYQDGKALARQAGISEEDLDAAEARAVAEYPFPL